LQKYSIQKEPNFNSILIFFEKLKIIGGHGDADVGFDLTTLAMAMRVDVFYPPRAGMQFTGFSNFRQK